MFPTHVGMNRASTVPHNRGALRFALEGCGPGEPVKDIITLIGGNARGERCRKSSIAAKFIGKGTPG